MKTKLIIILLLSAGIFAGCSKDKSISKESNQVTLNFRLTANGEPLQPGTNYINGSGETFTVSTFKIYVSSFSFRNVGTSQISNTDPACFLINMQDPASLKANVTLSSGQFNQLVFYVGVDSTRNVSGAQTGSLDPLNGMFWTWNTGYIFAKFEGNSSVSSNIGNSFVYHIGGFRTGENAIRKIILDFPGDQTITSGNIGTEIRLDIDLDRWFTGVNNISIASTPVWMEPGGLSLELADNYATMFSIQDIITP